MDRECWDPSESFIVSCVLCTSSLDWGEPGLRCNVGEPQPRCRQLFSLKIGCHLRADRNGIYQSIEFTNRRSYPTCKVPWRLKMCFANLAGGTGNFGSKYCTLVRTMTQQKSSWRFGHSESLKYQGWQVHTDFPAKIAQICEGWQVCSTSSVEAGWTYYFWHWDQSGFWWVVYSRQLFPQAGRSCDTDLECETTDETGRTGSCTCKAVWSLHTIFSYGRLLKPKLRTVWCSNNLIDTLFFSVRLGGTKMIRNIASQYLVTFQDIKKRYETTSGSGSCNECDSSRVQSVSSWGVISTDSLTSLISWIWIIAWLHEFAFTTVVPVTICETLAFAGLRSVGASGQKRNACESLAMRLVFY